MRWRNFVSVLAVGVLCVAAHQPAVGQSQYDDIYDQVGGAPSPLQASPGQSQFAPSQSGLSPNDPGQGRGGRDIPGAALPDAGLGGGAGMDLREGFAGDQLGRDLERELGLDGSLNDARGVGQIQDELDGLTDIDKAMGVLDDPAGLDPSLSTGLDIAAPEGTGLRAGERGKKYTGGGAIAAGPPGQRLGGPASWVQSGRRSVYDDQGLVNFTEITTEDGYTDVFEYSDGSTLTVQVNTDFQVVEVRTQSPECGEGMCFSLADTSDMKKGAEQALRQGAEQAQRDQAAQEEADAAEAADDGQEAEDAEASNETEQTQPGCDPTVSPCGEPDERLDARSSSSPLGYAVNPDPTAGSNDPVAGVGVIYRRQSDPEDWVTQPPGGEFGGPVSIQGAPKVTPGAAVNPDPAN
ncbi:MAG: hypothetical protein AAF909_13790 [Pseudomonadota bacterium]